MSKTDKERKELSGAAEIWATRRAGHRVICPACGSMALVNGEAIAPPSQTLKNHEISETQEYLPNQFECVACGLKVAGLSKLSVIELSGRYKKTQTYDAAEFYAPEDNWPEYEEDNNEPF